MRFHPSAHSQKQLGVPESRELGDALKKPAPQAAATTGFPGPSSLFMLAERQDLQQIYPH